MLLLLLLLLGRLVPLESEVAGQLATFYDPMISETNPKKPYAGKEDVVGDRQRLKLSNARMKELDEPQCIDWESFAEILLAANSNGDAEAAFDARLALVGELADYSNMHDFHRVGATCPPIKSDSCAKLRGDSPSTIALLCYRRPPEACDISRRSPEECDSCW